jgi:two-component system chemotaxis sensor kinase CheA
MDLERLRQKGVEKGLISEGAEVSDKELTNLIFAPGFSTAGAVTDVSGRGVGMDVVRSNIESLRGTVEIESRPGQGSTVTVKLPLTLAIIDGLQVQVGQDFFVLPLHVVEECIERRRDEEDSRGQEFVQLRGEIVPFVRLRSWFMINGSRPEIEQIVVVSSEGKRVGLVVDEVIGQFQTVIKSLSRVYKNVEGISGATIRGDGSMALIIDTDQLIQTVEHEVRSTSEGVAL